jgi:hypothetical protein
MEVVKSKYNIKELEEKLEYCKNMKLEDVTLDEVDDCLTNVLENLYR